jgi:hypothetical protein
LYLSQNENGALSAFCFPPSSFSDKPIRMSTMHRREFLKCTALTTSALAAPWLIPASARGADGVLPPSERVNVGLIGRGAMGSGHLRRLAGDPAFQLLAVCDVDATRRDAGKRAVEEQYAARRESSQYQGCAGTGAWARSSPYSRS